MSETVQSRIVKKRNILIAVDGSENSQAAFQYYLTRLCESGDHVVVFHALEVQPLPASPYPYGFAFYDEWQQCQEESLNRMKKLLRNFGNRLKEMPENNNITVKLIKEGGKPAGQLICKNVKDEGITFVVMGTRGQGTVRRTIFGTVSDFVVHHCSVPVCVVPPAVTS